MSFEDYVMRLSDFEFITKFIHAQVFERMRALLIEMEKPGQRRPR